MIFAAVPGQPDGSFGPLNNGNGKGHGGPVPEASTYGFALVGVSLLILWVARVRSRKT